VSPSKSQKTALVIEDNFFMAQLLSEKISHRGITPTHVQNGKDGLAHLKEETTHLVVLDLPLTGSTEGWKTLEAIRKSHKAEKLPIIVLLNTPDEALIKKATTLGATQVLVKADVNADGIVEAVAELLLGTTPESEKSAPKESKTKWPQAAKNIIKPAPAED
jgi:DNA-binding response OmpR family regulator